MSFARTKIQPPRQRAGLMARPALERALAQALAGQRLTLISAPAGFGKTAALTRQLERLPAGTALAWVSLDEGDDLPRLLECLFAALEPFDLPWRIDPDSLAMSAGGTRSERAAVAHELINTLVATDAPRGLIVLDDLHRSADAPLFEFLDLLAERLPSAWGVVIATRLDPPLSLSRWRAAGELAEFRQADLCFDQGEVLQLGATLDGQAGHALTGADAELLLARTGGWAAGLRLALTTALAERGQAQGIDWARAGQRMDRHLFDYLADEVLREMPGELREFLLRCSVLPELSATRCAAVSGDALAAQRLAEIERRELFVSVLDGPERTLRLHDLFRDFLDERLKREHAHELPELLRRAASGEADPLRRITYLVRAQDWQEAEQALADEGAELLTGGAVDAVVRLIELFPQAVREASASVQLLRGLAAWARWDWSTMNEAMQRAAALSRDAVQHQLARAYTAVALSGVGQRAQARELLHTLREEPLQGQPLLITLLLEAWAAFDDSRFADLAPLFRRQLEQLERTDSIALWYQCMPVPPYLALPGMRELLQRYVDGALARAAATPSTLRALALGLQGGLLVWAGRPDDALAVLAEAERDARWLGRPLNVSSMVYGQIAFAHTLRGDTEAARSAGKVHLEQNRSLGDRPGMLRLSFTAYCAARMALARGDDDEARAMLAMVEEEAQRGERPALVVTRRALPGYRALLAGDMQGAIDAFERALEEADRIDLFGHASELRVRLALCLAEAGRVTDAAQRLAPVFQRHRDNVEITP
ncbi:MAG: tetratricopeptide repeat protein, partial [Betaproteobacteria bacterium]